MKPSHRKDVIIARIIFAFICLALIGIIAGIIIAISSHHKSTVDKNKDTQTQTESESEETDVADESLFDDYVEDTELDTQIPTEIYVKTTTGVNLRAEASIEASVVDVIPEGYVVQLISENNGWAEVVFGDHTGFVSTEFVVEVTGDDITPTPVRQDTTAE